jgi:hypothetical protein
MFGYRNAMVELNGLKWSRTQANRKQEIMGYKNDQFQIGCQVTILMNNK